MYSVEISEKANYIVILASDLPYLEACSPKRENRVEVLVNYIKDFKLFASHVGVFCRVFLEDLPFYSFVEL